jgi:Rap1a immunity proteins
VAGESVMRLIAVLGVLLVLAPDYSAAQGSNNANERMPGCRDLIHDGSRDQSDAASQGLCLGEVVALLELAPLLPEPFRSCKPPGATPGQAVRVIVQYIDNAPERSHLNFILLAAAALARAWPCDK